jgi:hypothetical protein
MKRTLIAAATTAVMLAGVPTLPASAATTPKTKSCVSVWRKWVLVQPLRNSPIKHWEYRRGDSATMQATIGGYNAEYVGTSTATLLPSAAIVTSVTFTRTVIYRKHGSRDGVIGRFTSARLVDTTTATLTPVANASVTHRFDPVNINGKASSVTIQADVTYADTAHTSGCKVSA